MQACKKARQYNQKDVQGFVPSNVKRGDAYASPLFLCAKQKFNRK